VGVPYGSTPLLTVKGPPPFGKKHLGSPLAVCTSTGPSVAELHPTSRSPPAGPTVVITKTIVTPPTVPKPTDAVCIREGLTWTSINLYVRKALSAKKKHNRNPHGPGILSAGRLIHRCLPPSRRGEPCRGWPKRAEIRRRTHCPVPGTPANQGGPEELPGREHPNSRLSVSESGQGARGRRGPASGGGPGPFEASEAPGREGWVALESILDYKRTMVAFDASFRYNCSSGQTSGGYPSHV